MAAPFPVGIGFVIHCVVAAGRTAGCILWRRPGLVLNIYIYSWYSTAQTFHVRTIVCDVRTFHVRIIVSWLGLTLTVTTGLFHGRFSYG